MKVLGINGSAKKDGNTAIIIQKVFEELNSSGIETELVQFAGQVVNTDTLEIKISLTKENHREVIVVADNGSGVDSDKLSHLFEQFYRGDESRSKKNSEGNGLGLYIAKYIVEAFAGIITAENDKGRAPRWAFGMDCINFMLDHYFKVRRLFWCVIHAGSVDIENNEKPLPLSTVAGLLDVRFL